MPDRVLSGTDQCLAICALLALVTDGSKEDAQRWLNQMSRRGRTNLAVKVEDLQEMALHSGRGN